MRERIIFLDFDGVLNSVRSATADEKIINAVKAKHNLLLGNKNVSGFDPVAVKLLWRLIEKTNAFVVVSSTWRKAIGLRDIRQIFHTEFGWPTDDNERIIGITGTRDNGHRGMEIQDWINNHTSKISNFKYIIIDDSYDFNANQLDRFIQTDPYEGFLYKDYTKAIDLFGAELDEEIL